MNGCGIHRRRSNHTPDRMHGPSGLALPSWDGQASTSHHRGNERRRELYLKRARLASTSLQRHSVFAVLSGLSLLPLACLPRVKRLRCALRRFEATRHASSQSRATLCHHTTMAIPKRALLLSSCALTFFSKKYAPDSPFTQAGYVKTVLALFAIQYFARAFYNVLVYPFFLSPLRHLPQPPVRSPSHLPIFIPMVVPNFSSRFELKRNHTAYDGVRTGTPSLATSRASSAIHLESRSGTGLTTCLTMACCTTAGCSMRVVSW